ncbi:hypothetical protein [Aeromonas veronii]|uniref:hypothetical protein n=1 Tax=Aeromonas veronii TaxID=654 RepID=UPI003BA038D7
MLTDPNKQAALERALHQIAQLQASQPAGLSISTESRFRCKSIERDLAVEEMMKDAGALQWETPKSIMLSLYDAGYRKQS